MTEAKPVILHQSMQVENNYLELKSEKPQFQILEETSDRIYAQHLTNMDILNKYKEEEKDKLAKSESKFKMIENYNELTLKMKKTEKV